MYDVIVVGAGPAGASAAHVLAEAGLRVALVDKEMFPRYKACGGGLVHRARQLIPVPVGTVVERECRVAEMFLWDARLHFEVARTEPIVSMCMRAELDSALARAAESAGAEVMAGWHVNNVVQHPDTVEVQGDKGRLSARFLVGADGVTSTVARRTGFDGARPVAPAIEWEIEVADDLLERFSRSARFDFGIISYGYGWIFPKRSHLSVGVGSARRAPVNLRKLLQNYLQMCGISRVEKAERHGWLIPAGPRRGPWMRGRVLLAGDAVGFLDPLSGEGLTFSILSGQLAGRAIAQSGLEPARAAAAYAASIEQDILSEVRWGTALGWLLYSKPAIRSMLFRCYGQSFCEMVADVLMARASYRQLLTHVPNYLKLLRFWRFGSSGKTEARRLPA